MINNVTKIYNSVYGCHNFESMGQNYVSNLYENAREGAFHHLHDVIHGALRCFLRTNGQEPFAVDGHILNKNKLLPN